MLNKIWFWLLAIGILYGLGKAAVLQTYGTPAPAVTVDTDTNEQTPSVPTIPILESGQNISQAALDAAELAVSICITLIGVMVLWLGLLNIAREAGMVDALARLLSPLMRWLFPEVPDGHPAQGAILMNMAANIMGLDNAATPFGLKAMRELQTLNPSQDTATNAMATFLAINTSSVTLIPISIVALRVAAGSSDPLNPIAGIILATSISTVVAITAVRILQRWPRFAKDNPSPVATN